MTDDKMPLTAHLEELRRRLIVSLIAIAAGFGICYGFSEWLFALLVRPIVRDLPEGSALQYIGITEAFVTYLKISFFGGLLLAMPLILYETWKFVAPGLHEHERKYVIPFILFSTMFFFGGASFCYFIVFPFAFKYFMSFSGETLKAMPTVREYLSFATYMLVAFGLVFEMPVFFFFLGRIGLINYKGLARQRGIAIVIIFVAAAVLTPGPDVLSQLLLAGPLLILFELSLQILRITGRKPAEYTEDPETPEQELAG